jgi:hypothetical protein
MEQGPLIWKIKAEKQACFGERVSQGIGRIRHRETLWVLRWKARTPSCRSRCFGKEEL